MVDYHIHTHLCGHACGTMAAYVQTAIDNGLTEMGFADHLPMLKWWQPDYSMTPEQLPEYVRQVHALQRQFPEISIKLGIEADYYSQSEEAATRTLLEQYPFDYVYGSVHFLDSWAFDDPERVAEWDSHDVNEVYRRYFTLVEQAVRSELFDVLGHMDLVKKFGHRPSQEMAGPIEQVVKACRDTGMAIEINTAGLRKPVKEIYPSPAILQLIRQYQIPIVLGSDAHAPHEVAYHFDDVRTMLHTYGFTHIVKFAAREIVEECPL
jgi:histidinol-phosphatase (PHP family)